MESYAVGSISKKEKLPLIIIKSVSDIVGDNEFCMQKAVFNLDKFFSDYFKSLDD